MHEKMELTVPIQQLGQHIMVEDGPGRVSVYIPYRTDYVDLTPLEAINLAGLLTDAAYRSMNE